MINQYINKYILVFLGLLALSFTTTAHNHSMEGTTKAKSTLCEGNSILCAKTVTSAFAPNGDLWRLWTINDGMYYQISNDNGQHFKDPQRVDISLEKISARNENRPKIGFDNNKGVYLSWAMPREKKFTADVRFSYSNDYGKTFSTPITVNNDNLLAGHSFNEMIVSESGEVHIVWLDGRLSAALRKVGKKAKGSALFYAQAKPNSGITQFTNQQLANETCVCCRISVDVNQQGELAIFWRHIYGDNIREFALLTLDEKNLNQPIQISHDHWKINGCPHQGGAISIDESNTYHMVWFNQGDKGKGIFYASSTDQGQSLTQPISIGDNQAQAAHPHLMQSDRVDENGVVEQVIDVVWTQYTGTAHQLWHQQSQG